MFHEQEFLVAAETLRKKRYGLVSLNDVQNARRVALAALMFVTEDTLRAIRGDDKDMAKEHEKTTEGGPQTHGDRPTTAKTLIFWQDYGP
jgi:hypothetical protein